MSDIDFTDETRRGILQSVGEIGRGLKVISAMLKMGQFGSARDQIIGIEAMLGLHEGLSTSLLKENTRLQRQLDAAAALAEEWRYKGEHGWGAWQEGDGPDHEGFVLDGAASELRKVLEEEA
jgi:hypothetical protein